MEKPTCLVVETSLQKSEKFLFNDLTARFLKNPNNALSGDMSLPLYSNTCTHEKQRV
jgi:hypothetical protein